MTAKNDGEALFFRKRRDRLLKRFLQLLVLDLMVRRDGARVGELALRSVFCVMVAFQRRLLSPAASAGLVEDEVPHDGEKPGRELGGRLIARRAFPNPDEHLLGDVVGIIQVSEHPCRRPDHDPLVQFHQPFKGPHIPLFDTQHEPHVFLITACFLRALGHAGIKVGRPFRFRHDRVGQETGDASGSHGGVQPARRREVAGKFGGLPALRPLKSCAYWRPVTFRHPKNDVFIPDNSDPWTALRRVTHLGIVSHQDDLEIAAYHGITECFHSGDKWFGGVVVTDGAGSPRKGVYADYTDEEMQRVRLVEQRKAAFVGEYSVMIQLGYPSDEVKQQNKAPVVQDLKFILEHAQPDILYVHNPCDRHDTHVATFLRCIEAIRELPAEMRPKKVYGCEVWRKLDWLLTEDKVMLWVDKYPHLLRPLLGVFDSQISGGKRYDLAEEGLRHANATYFDSHTTDKTSLLTFAMDLTPLAEDAKLDVEEYTIGYVRRLEQDVAARLKRFV